MAAFRHFCNGLFSSLVPRYSLGLIFRIGIRPCSCLDINVNMYIHVYIYIYICIFIYIYIYISICIHIYIYIYILFYGFLTYRFSMIVVGLSKIVVSEVLYDNRVFNFVVLGQG